MRVAGVVAVGAVAGAIAGLLTALLITKKAQILPFLGSSGDEPILMAGGSMYISTSPDYTDDFAPMGNDLVYSLSTNFVRKMEVRDSMDMSHSFTFDGSQSVVIDISICRLNPLGECRSNGTDGGLEIVELQTTASAAGMLNQGLKITSKVPAGSAVTPAPMAQAIKLLNHLWLHPRRKKSMLSISVAGYTSGTALPDRPCLPDGDCSLTIHYCPKNQDCS